MARSYAKLYGSIWRDPDWRQLDTHAQRLYLLILSQPEITNCGVVPYVPIRWSSMASDTPLDNVLTIAHELELQRFIVLDEDTSEVLIRSFVKHDKVAEQPKLVPAALRQFEEIQSVIIRTALADSYPHLFKLRDNEIPAIKPIDSHPEAYADGYRKAYARAPGRQPLTFPLDGRPPTATAETGKATTAAAANPEDQVEEPDPRLLELADAGWARSQIEHASADPDRALALLHHYQADPTSDSPPALAWTRFADGLSVPKGTPPTQEATMIPLTDAWHRFLHGHGWDNYYDQDAMLDELRRLRTSRKTTGDLTDSTALEQWHTARQERYPDQPDDDPEPAPPPATLERTP